MARKNKNKNSHVPSGIIPYAKKSGLTSFSSLWNIKNALNTDKVGHTGTLDSFADGLLVVLSGSLTHLVPHITGFRKTYLAVVCFGKETDTLDPTGKVVKTGKSVSKQSVIDILPKFSGALLQRPPAFSALHVNGMRASDLAREGKEVKLEERAIFIYANELLDFKEDDGKGVSYALLKIECSKGTYIRALARDIAEALGTVSHLSALRRTQVGVFSLTDAACFNELEEFTIERAIRMEKDMDWNGKKVQDDIFEIRNHFMNFIPETAFSLGFNASYIRQDSKKLYLNGRPLYGKMFNRIAKSESSADKLENEYNFPDEIAVFYENDDFAGMINKKDGRLSYGFVVPPVEGSQNKAAIEVYSWDDVVNGKFPVDYVKKGTAVSVGTFDGMHIGHKDLLESVKNQQNLVPGIITFSSGLKSISKNNALDVFSEEEKLSYARELGMRFAVVVDFSEDFSKMEGRAFIDTLVCKLGMKFMAEGKDFNCGNKGAFTSKDIYDYSIKADDGKSFVFDLKDDVLIDGEKVSSTRIRSCVKNGDFLTVQKMLGRPFSVDFSAIDFKSVGSTTADGEWFESKEKYSMLLPSNGTHEVVVQLGKGSEEEVNVLHTVCEVKDEKIKILLPSQNYAQKLTKVIFN